MEDARAKHVEDARMVALGISEVKVKFEPVRTQLAEAFLHKLNGTKPEPRPLVLTPTERTAKVKEELQAKYEKKIADVKAEADAKIADLEEKVAASEAVQILVEKHTQQNEIQIGELQSQLREQGAQLDVILRLVQQKQQPSQDAGAGSNTSEVPVNGAFTWMLQEERTPALVKKTMHPPSR